MDENKIKNDDKTELTIGLSKREYFASNFMQALIIKGTPGFDYTAISKMAIRMADTLLGELENR